MLLDILYSLAPQLRDCRVPPAICGSEGYAKFYSALRTDQIFSMLLASPTDYEGSWLHLTRLELSLHLLADNAVNILADSTGGLLSLVVHVKKTERFELIRNLIAKNPRLDCFDIRLPSSASDPIDFVFPSFERDLLVLPLFSKEIFGVPLSKLLLDTDDVFRIVFSSNLRFLNPDVLSKLYEAVFAESSQRRRLEALAIAAIRLMHFEADEDYDLQLRLILIGSWLNGKLETETGLEGGLVESKVAAIAVLEMLKLCIHREDLVIPNGAGWWMTRFRAILDSSGYVAAELQDLMLRERSSAVVLDMMRIESN